jgi:nucleotidyltransferase substrate binding protein (TIGR01987 family)
MIEYDKFQKSLQHLEEQYGHFLTLDKNLPDWMQQAVTESVIQRYEICFDCMWKVLRRYLSEEIGLSELPNGPKPLFRLANENNLLSSTIDQWIKYTNVRNSTSHDYSGEKAKAAIKKVGDFVDDAIGLYTTMSGNSW